MKVKTYSNLDDLPASYLSLFEKGEQEWYDFSFSWFNNFAQTALDKGDKICIYGVEQNFGTDMPLAALATRFSEESSGLFSTTQLSSLSNFYTITYSPVYEASAAIINEVFGLLAKAIAMDGHKWDTIKLLPLEQDSPAYASLVSSFRSAGMVVQEFFCFGNWYLPTAGLSYEQYFKTLPSAMQNTIRRKVKKLTKTGRARIEIVTGAENLETSIAAYERIYLSSWKRPEPYPHFVPGLIRTCAKKNWLRMGVIYLEDQPIAAQVWIVNSGRATIYKLGQDQKYDEFSAGSVLTANLMEHVLDVDRVKEVDFGSGDDPYKKNWLPQRRERWGILAMNPRSLAGCLGIIRNVGGRAAKNAWRAVRRLPAQPRLSIAEHSEDP
jgi:GNAT acetyltransferase-like protein